MPGGDLLSHGEAPHYHRRAAFSLPSSEWDRVVPAGYGHQANLESGYSGYERALCACVPVRFTVAWVLYGQAARSISTSRLHVLPRVDRWPINVVVFDGPSGGRASGDLILGGASRLDAFSGYPVRT